MKHTFRAGLPNGLFGDPLVIVRLRWSRRTLLLDCGDTSRIPARSLLDCRQALVSHAHVDHVFGLGRLLRVHLDHPERALEIFGPPGMARQLRSYLGAFTWNLVDAFPIDLSVSEIHEHRIERWRFPRERGFEPACFERRDRRDDEPVHRDETLEILACPLDHAGVASICYLIREHLDFAVDKVALERSGLEPGPWLGRLKQALRDGSADATQIRLPSGCSVNALQLSRELIRERPGDTIAYATDLSPTSANITRLASLARQTRRLVLEAYYCVEDRSLGLAYGHLCTEDAARVAREAAADALCPVHLSSRYEHDPQRVLNELQRLSHSVPLALLPQTAAP
ncbi:MAG: MBL fold metallo-hydrolase [Acidobacteriota bacterium]|nr:MAG: MBL fold metallo-hydrolase [Acidobacteriota bacterium]